MGANARSKGQRGEREICDMLNTICIELDDDSELGVNYNPDFPKFQRNQNQSAVGGSDITNPYGLSIEVKRQEQLSVNTWWNQCLEAAETTGELPVLIYKQNRKAWRIRMWMDMDINIGGKFKSHIVVAETDVESFKNWAREYIKTWHEVNKNAC